MLQRRTVLAAPFAAALAPAAESEPRVAMSGDGIPHTPAEHAALLARISDGIQTDDYSLGGVVEKLETTMASLLGKEAAMWMPTGTLANHLAVRTLAGPRRRVIVQAESHLFRDSGDCAQTLSGLHLAPLAPGAATIPLAELESAASEAMTGRVATPIGAIQIETPVRRRSGERVDFEEMKRISAWARERGIGMHLDGARLPLESAVSGRPLRDYTALFDTVYVSMWKFYNAPSGAILAGPRKLLDGMHHTRRMFGGALPASWPFAAVALHYSNGFEQRFRKAMDHAERVISALTPDSNFEFQRIPNGTNIFRMRVRNVNAPVYGMRLEQNGIDARAPGSDWFSFQVNETWARVAPEVIVERLRKALG